MILTVGELKRYLQDIPDDAIFGTMHFADKAEIQTYAPKRFLLLQSGKKGYDGPMFVLNNMGTHWNEEWAQKNDANYVGHVDSRDYKLHLNNS